MRKIIVYDSDHPAAVDNRCFEPEFQNGEDLSFTIELADTVRKLGYEIITGDVFLRNTYSGDVHVLLFTEMYSANTRALIRKGAVPLICFCMESPIVARSFYMNIKALAGQFKHNYQFKGTADALAGMTQFSTMYFPVKTRIQVESTDWTSRDFLVLINSNKRAFYSDTSSLSGRVRSLISRLRYESQKMFHPWVRSKEIYNDRIEAIYYFSSRPDFHLYGRGWAKKISGFSNDYYLAAQKAYKGALPLEGKLPTMSRYKFAICFENCSFPGYVTEKIFDCFLAGCIPIYFGAPDIEDFVPKDAFIDYRKFDSFQALESYLEHITPDEAMAMLNASRKFLQSQDFDKFLTSSLIADMVNKADESSLHLKTSRPQATISHN